MTTLSEAVPEYQRPFNEEKLTEFHSLALKNAEESSSEQRPEQIEAYENYWGSGLSEGERSWLKATSRADIDVNLTLGTINSILGHHMSQRKEAIFRGVDTDVMDKATGDAATRVVRQLHNQSDGPRQESLAILDMLLTGQGWLETYLDTMAVPVVPVRCYVPMWEMFPDPTAQRTGYADARYLIRKRPWSLDEAQATWPQHRDKISLRTLSEVGNTHAKPSVQGQWRQRYVDRRNAVPISDFQYYRYEPMVDFKEPGSSDWKTLPKKQFDELMTALEEQHQRLLENRTALETMLAEGSIPDEEVAETERQIGKLTQDMQLFSGDFAKNEHPGKVFWRAQILGQGSGSVVLRHERLEEGMYTYSAVTGYRRTNLEDATVQYFGTARVVRDLQHYINASISRVLEILSRGSQGGGFIHKSLLTSSPQAFRKNMATPGWWEITKAEINSGTFYERKPATMPPGLSDFIGLLQDFFASVSGATEFWKGTATTERSEVLVSNLQQQTVSMLAPLYDGISSFQIRNGLLMAKMVHHHVSGDTINRIVGNWEVEGVTTQTVPQQDPATGEVVGEVQQPTGMTAATLLKQSDPTKFDITTDTGVASPNERLAAWKTFQPLLPVLKEMHPILMEKMLVNVIEHAVPLPAEITAGMAEDIKEAFAAAAQQQAQAQQGAQQP